MMGVIIFSDKGSASLPKVGSKLMIGRDSKQCKLALPADATGVSRVHATIEWKSERQLVLTDSSTYGTGVQGSTINKTSTQLNNLDRITVGETVFTVDWALPADEVPPVPTARSKRPLLPQHANDAKRPKTTNEVQKNYSSSQTKMQDYFSKSRSSPDNENEVLAEDTPAYRLLEREQVSVEAVSMIVDSQTDRLASSRSIRAVEDDIEVIEDEDFKVPCNPAPPTSKRVKKTSVLFKNQRGTAASLSSSRSPQLLAPDTVSVSSDIRNQTGIDTEWVSDSQRSRRSLSNMTTASQECVVPSQPPSEIGDELNLSDVHSQMHFDPLANSTQRTNTVLPQAPTATRASNTRPKKRSILQGPPVVKKEMMFATEELLPKRVASMLTERVPSPAVSQKPVIALIANDVLESASVPPLKKRGRPRKEMQQTRQEVVAATNSFSSSMRNDLDDLTVNNTNVHISMVSSGKKYEDDEEESMSLLLPVQKKKVKEVDIEKVIKNMDRMISFANLTREHLPSCSADQSGFDKTASSSGGANFKRFKKAGQGRFNSSLCKVNCMLAGSSDLVDFRKIRN